MSKRNESLIAVTLSKFWYISRGSRDIPNSNSDCNYPGISGMNCMNEKLGAGRNSAYSQFTFQSPRYTTAPNMAVELQLKYVVYIKIPVPTFFGIELNAFFWEWCDLKH